MIANRNRATILFILVLTFAPARAQENAKTTLADLAWLEGTWQQADGKAVFEKWTQVSARTLEGESFSVQEGDTTYFEFLRLEQYGDEIYYVPKVAHNKYPVPFHLTGKQDGAFVFENPEHDFPQRIRYRVQSDGALHVRVEGKKNGEIGGSDFYFKKVK